MTGFVEHSEVPRYVAACDILYGVIDPDHWGSPMKVYEYMACRRPVVTYASKEFEFVEEDGVGWTVDEVTTAAVAEVLREAVATSIQSRLKMGERGRQYVEENRTWKRLAENVVRDIRHKEQRN
jgi:glycosyltransferase involved in cell wall biosynthesis